MTRTTRDLIDKTALTVFAGLAILGVALMFIWPVTIWGLALVLAGFMIWILLLIWAP